ncbi:MAG: cation:proton antiporter [Bacteroidales bacterium]|nr:cation:proton antiporter [Bacteroidales bacterium]
MSHLPALISDLALILIVAGIVTIVFRWLKQPLVLGYIVAGLLAGPHIGLLPAVADTADIAIWADIGVIFLLFALGLEFSVKKLVRVGKTGVVTAVTEVVTMFVIGLVTGRALGWTSTDSMFLGGMLSMSSTTIIIKAFDDLDLRRERFASLVFGVLVVEDLVAVLLMVLLSTISVSQSFSGAELLQNLLKLAFFLTISFVVGIYLVPTLLRKSEHMMSDETLLVICVGLCLVMVILAVTAGFSSALGAFMMGSILAETVLVERIERVLKPLKDFFGAIFFVSVGMMVSPQVLLDYALPIAVITVVTVLGKLACSSMGLLLSGQSLKVSLQSGFSLAQIGEFAFIIASLGQSLHVTSDFLYPVVVSVSVVTTFFTPYLISMGEPVYHFVERLLPDAWRKRLCREPGEVSRPAGAMPDDGVWREVLKGYTLKFMVLAVILYALTFLSFTYLVPFLQRELPAPYADIASAVITLLAMAPFLRAMMYGADYQPSIVLNLWLENARNKLVLSLLMMLRMLAAFAFVVYVLMRLFAVPPLITFLITLLLLAVSARSKGLLKWYWHIESRFLVNLNERQIEAKRQQELARGVRDVADVESLHWLDSEMYVVAMKLYGGNPYIGKVLKETDLRSKYNIFVIRVQPSSGAAAAEDVSDYDAPDAFLEPARNIPSGDYLLREGDVLYLTGGKVSLMRLPQIQSGWRVVGRSLRTLREFSLHERQYTEGAEPLMCMAISVDAKSGLLHASLREQDLSKKTGCLIIGLERRGRQMVNPFPDTVLQENDMIWIIGEEKPVSELIERNVGL